jgi:hypothetical protein
MLITREFEKMIQATKITSKKLLLLNRTLFGSIPLHELVPDFLECDSQYTTEDGVNDLSASKLESVR